MAGRIAGLGSVGVGRKERYLESIEEGELYGGEVVGGCFHRGVTVQQTSQLLLGE